MTDQPPDVPHIEEPFTSMAERIRRNDGTDFAGAFVLCPPNQAPIAMLLLDDKATPALFWGTLKSRVEMAMQELEEAERGSNIYGRR